MNKLTDKEQDFLREVDARITKQRSFFSTIIAVLTAAVITLGASNIAGVAANKQRLNAVEHDVKNIKTYYVDVFMFDELVNSIQLYTSHVINSTRNYGIRYCIIYNPRRQGEEEKNDLAGDK